MLGSIFNSGHFSGNFVTFFSSILLIVRLNFLSRLLQFIRVLNRNDDILSIQNGRSKMADISTSFFFSNKEYWSYKWESVPSPHPHLHPGPRPFTGSKNKPDLFTVERYKYYYKCCIIWVLY